ncbi:MAG: polysaccharide biosynthesis C-terminal domain-containing protein [Bdellovibrionales bacterium]|nr:polysaccharide biosynthesis C-terminal domain-containing protein [Bdellovibrionales bacterium]
MTQNSQPKHDESLWHLLRLSFPLVISFCVRSLFTLVDTIYAGFLSDSAIAAIGLAIPIEFAMIAVWVGVSAGFTSYISKGLLSPNQRQDFQSYLIATRRLVKLVSPSFIVLGFVLYWIAPLLNLSPEVTRDFQIYSTVMLSGSGLTAFWSIIPDSIVKAHHDTRSTMNAGLISNGLNLALNTIFVFVFHWGIFGIALSTVIGRLGGLLYALRKADSLEKSRHTNLNSDEFDLSPPSIEEIQIARSAILRLAVPSGLSYILMSLETSLVNFFLARVPNSTSAIAAYGIYYRVMLLALMPMIASTVALLPFVGRLYQRQAFDSIKRTYLGIMGIGAIYTLTIVLPLSYFADEPILNLLTETSAMIDYGTFAIKIVPWVCLASVPFIFGKPLFEGFHRGRPVILLAILRYVLLAVPGCAIAVFIAPLFNVDAFRAVMWSLVLTSITAITCSYFISTYYLRLFSAKKD